jgi:hypothetical protein
MFYSPEIIKEHLSFESNDGKMQAPRGEHDDTVMATAMAFFGHAKAAPPINRKIVRRAANEKKPDLAHSRGIWAAIMAKISHDQRRQKPGDKRPSVRRLGTRKP